MFSETSRDWNFALGLRALTTSAGCVPRFESIQNVNDLGPFRSRLLSVNQQRCSRWSGPLALLIAATALLSERCVALGRA